MNTREREVIAAARALAVRYQRPGEDVIDRFERVAEMFRRETGFMAPGKDAPAAAYAGEDRARERDDAWNAWSRKPIDDLVEALAAYDALVAEGSASSEGAEAVAPRYVQWTEAGGVRVDLDSFFKSDAGKAALAHFEQRSCEGLDDGEAQRASAWLAVVSVLDEVAPTWHRDSIGTGREQVCAAIRALAQRTSERRPIADETVERACIAAAVAIDGNDPWEEFTETNKAEVRKAVRAVLEWYESAHPRGLPAGSDALVRREIQSLREHAIVSDDCCYGTLATGFVREHCDRIEAALASTTFALLWAARTTRRT